MPHSIWLHNMSTVILGLASMSLWDTLVVSFIKQSFLIKVNRRRNYSLSVYITNTALEQVMKPACVCVFCQHCNCCNTSLIYFFFFSRKYIESSHPSLLVSSVLAQCCYGNWFSDLCESKIFFFFFSDSIENLCRSLK